MTDAKGTRCSGLQGIHSWRLAKIEARYAKGAWAIVNEVSTQLALKSSDEDDIRKPTSIGTMGLFYCERCLGWTTSEIPQDLPGFGGNA